ncbi:hypothetical protein FNT36_02390 [Hymenobacter setariae]|uniref:STAS/SEC14 domain-containing protein n=1 Tax=Hymenobacter setariae TaxID=2594794 RepID=A0A558C2B6_9BACT|nr:hypothetical protein [Hymenobacter setariae]TVT42961.1 hypothetical protein FNT36_02390 [Hymenobacter setariae]
MLPALTTPYCEVYLHLGPAAALEMRWLSYVPSAEFRANVEQALALARRQPLLGWVADDRLLGAVRPRDLDWVLQTVLPAIEAAGVERFALLESQDAINRMTIAGMYEQALPARDFEVRQFMDNNVARAWATGHDQAL